MKITTDASPCAVLDYPENLSFSQDDLAFPEIA
jgi:hypothetical protein